MIIEKSQISNRYYQHLREILGKVYIKSEIESPFDFISLADMGIDANIILNFQSILKSPDLLLMSNLMFQNLLSITG